MISKSQAIAAAIAAMKASLQLRSLGSGWRSAAEVKSFDEANAYQDAGDRIEAQVKSAIQALEDDHTEKQIRRLELTRDRLIGLLKKLGYDVTNVLREHPGSGKTELAKRYDEALCLLRRCEKVLLREGWQGGEMASELYDAVASFVGHEELEAEIFPDSKPIPWVKRATGREIPDLTGREHVCEWQQKVLAQELPILGKRTTPKAKAKGATTPKGMPATQSPPPSPPLRDLE